MGAGGGLGSSTSGRLTIFPSHAAVMFECANSPHTIPAPRRPTRLMQCSANICRAKPIQPMHLGTARMRELWHVLSCLVRCR